MSQTTNIIEHNINEHDFVNYFAYSGTIPVTKGTAVTFVSSSGFRTNETDSKVLGWPGMSSYGNTVSTQWGTQALVRNAGSGDAVLGILRYDVRSVDENNIPLTFYSQKAAENNWILSGQTVPIITRGFVFYSGYNIGGTVSAGAKIYVSGAAGSEGGELFAGTNASTAVLGRAWGGKGDRDFFLLEVNPAL